MKKEGNAVMLELTPVARDRMVNSIVALAHDYAQMDAAQVGAVLASDRLNDSVDAFFFGVFAELRALRKAKENDYGSSWRQKGAKGVLVRMGDKMARLDALLWKKTPQQVMDEKIEDTAADLINYTLFLLYCLAEGNIE